MKNTLLKIFRLLFIIVLIAKILNWFLNFSEATNQILNVVMFSLIGLYFIVVGYQFNGKTLKVIFLICGSYLIVMNFFPKNTVLTLIGIACVLIPLVIGRFSKETRPDMPEKDA